MKKNILLLLLVISSKSFAQVDAEYAKVIKETCVCFNSNTSAFSKDFKDLIILGIEKELNIDSLTSNYFEKNEDKMEEILGGFEDLAVWMDSCSKKNDPKKLVLNETGDQDIEYAKFEAALKSCDECKFLWAIIMVGKGSGEDYDYNYEYDEEPQGEEKEEE